MTITQAIITVVTSVIGSGALFTFVQFMIQRHDKKVDRLKPIEDKLDALTDKVEKLELSDIEQRKETMKIQLAQLMSDYPDHTAEIFEIAHKYFCKYNGNSFIHPLFVEWMSKNNLKAPTWFKPTK